MSRIYLIVILLLSFTVEIQAGESVALLIGISQYHEVDNLAFADRDVLEFADFLTSFSNFLPSNIDIITNQEATKLAISTRLEKLIAKSQSAEFDNTILMFCGHGRPSMKKKTNIFFAPTDASVSESRFVERNGIVTNNTFITKDWIAQKAADIRAKKVVLIFDSCYSGIKDFATLYKHYLKNTTFSSATTSTSSDFFNPGNDKKVAFVAASSESQETIEAYELKHGALTYCILEYLDFLRQETPAKQWVDVSVGSMFKNIIHLFENVRVNLSSNTSGRNQYSRLSDFSTPVLFSIPERRANFAFLHVKGSKVVTNRTGNLKIATTPPSVTVLVDGKVANRKTNCTLRLKEGIHRIELYVPTTNFRHTFTVQIENEKTLRKTFDLYGKLNIKSFWEEDQQVSEGPPIAVFIDKVKYGVTNNLELNRLISGTHNVEIEFKTIKKQRKIEIRQDSPLLVKFVFVRKPGKEQPYRRLNKLPI